ncbi:MAG: ABC transporter substrate-binding protein [Anaerolineae bacterium]
MRRAATVTVAAFACLLLSASVLAAAAQPLRAQEAQPVTFYRWAVVDAPSLDPHRAADPTSAEIVENLFLALTDYDPQTGAVRPELARVWEIAEDGQTFTFTLRDDVFWVRYDPDSRLTARVRAVTAQDFVDGIRRACEPTAAPATAALLASVIEGCAAVNQTAPEFITLEALALVGVSAPDPVTLVIRTREPAPWFLAMTPALRPVLLDDIRRYGDGWTLPGNIVTNGPFVLSGNGPNRQMTLLRANPHLPADLEGPGNVARVVFDVAPDASAGYALYLEHAVDVSRFSPEEAAAYLFAGVRPPEALEIPEMRVGYFGFAHDRAPFNDVRVRRAFAAALDREAFVAQALGGVGLPMTHFAPPEVFGAPVRDAGADVGYDPDYAREQLAAAGYRDCFGFPSVTLMAFDSASAWVDFALRAWEEVLGCEAQVFNVQLVRFPQLLERTDASAVPSRRPHIFTLLWLGEYPDEHNWVGDVLWCEAAPRTGRVCTETDDLIAEAAVARDAEARRALYAQVEAAFFGPDGEAPVAPLYQWVTWLSVKPWVSGPLATDLALGGLHWDWVEIDAAEQARCRAEGAGAAGCTIPFLLPSPAPTGTPTRTPTSAALPTLTVTAAPTTTPTVVSVPISATATNAPTTTPTVFSVPAAPTVTAAP